MAGDDTTAVGSQAVVILSAEQAAKLAGISLQRLAYWQRKELVVPSIEHQFSQRNTVRAYEFPQLVELLVAARLRSQFSLQQLRDVVGRLRRQGYAAPLRELKFAVGDDGRLYFQHPDGAWEGNRRPGQGVWHVVLNLEEIVAQIHGATRRDPTLGGQTTRRRGVLGGKETFAGTRVPVATVVSYLAGGRTPAQIIEAFPSLTEADVATARARLDQAS